MLNSKHPYIEALVAFILFGVVAAIVIPPYNHIHGAALPVVRSLALFVMVVLSAFVTVRGVTSASGNLGRVMLGVVLCIYMLILVGIAHQLWKGVLS